MIRNAKKNLQGTVVSTKMEKTIIVTVETKRKHPLYHKQVKYSKRYKAHDQDGIANVGDIVIITETRPLSATKRFRLSSIVERAK